MPDKARELTSMAADCRELAERAKTETVREQLLDMADQFERLAEQRLKSRSPIPAR
jgi:hypothetical protein